jgi:hypothetical protein
MSVLLMMSLFSCQDTITTNPEVAKQVKGGLSGSLPKANGTTGQVLVSIDNGLWDGDIETIFTEKFSDTAKGPYIYYEPVLSFQQEDPSTINRIRKKNRNFLRVFLDSSKTYTETEVIVKNEYKAQGQLYVIFRDSNKERLIEFLNSQLSTYIALFNIEEDDRLVTKYNLNKNLSFDNTAKKKFGVSISIPLSAKFVANKDSIIYALDKKVDEKTKDNPKTGAKGGTYWSQKGIMIWESPYENEQSFTPINVLSFRDSVLKENVKGTVVNSYMTTEYAGSHKPKIQFTDLKGNNCMIIEGLWKHDGNIAASGGGPFIQYSIVHPTRKTIVHISTHIFAPRFNKREYIRQIRAMLNTITLVD